MKVLNSSNVHRIELWVPILKDLQFLNGLSGWKPSDWFRDDPFGQLMEAQDDLADENVRGGLLSVTDRATEAIEERAREVKASLMLLDIQERVTRFVSDESSAVLSKSLAAWTGLCSNPELSKPVEEDLPIILLHAPAAWRGLEDALKLASIRFFLSQNLVRGRYEEDGSVDLSLVYTLLTRKRWNAALPKNISSALKAFCQREYFLTIDGKPALYAI